MIRWEYVVDGFSRWDAPQLQDVLNERGTAGWELVSVSWDLRLVIFRRWS